MAPSPNGVALARNSNNAATSSKAPKLKAKPESIVGRLNMKRKEDRLKTFDNWPVSYIDKNAMASTGFYSLKEKDIVRCVFCGVEIGHWEEDDDPVEEHKRWAPSCPYLRGLVVNNDENNELGVVRSRAFDVTGIYNMEIRPCSGPENGKGAMTNASNSKTLPRHCTFMTSNARMKSFESWPKSLKPEPEQLSEAGFFYSGESDRTTCFFCGGGLKNWKPTDDPWKEHCKWFPQCSYVILHKSKEFRERALAIEDPMLPAERIQNLMINEKSLPKMLPEKLSVSTSKEFQEPTGNSSNDSHLCKICFQEQLGVVFLPCGHLVSCVKCAISVTQCPVCRKPLTATVRTFLS